MIKVKRNRGLLRTVAAGMAVSMVLMGTGCSKDRPSDPDALETSTDTVVETSEEATGIETEPETELATEPETTDLETTVGETESEMSWEIESKDDRQFTDQPIVMLDNELIKVEYLGAVEEDGQIWISYDISKKDSRELCWKYNLCINGIIYYDLACATSFCSVVQGKETAECLVNVSKDELEAYGVSTEVDVFGMDIAIYDDQAFENEVPIFKKHLECYPTGMTPDEIPAPAFSNNEFPSVIDTPDYNLGIYVVNEDGRMVWKYDAENKSDEKITFQLCDFVKNGFTIDWIDEVWLELEPGKKFTGIIYDDEDHSSFKVGDKLECRFCINIESSVAYSGWDPNRDIVFSEIVYSGGYSNTNRLYYDMDEAESIHYPEEPVVLPFENDNLKIELDKIRDDNVDGTDVKVIELSIRNKRNSDRNYKFTDIIINGIHFSSNVMVIGDWLESNIWLVSEIYLPKIELERLGIEKIEEIILKMELYDENICELIDRFYVVAYPEGKDGKHFEEIKSTRVPDNVVDNELFRFEAFKEKNEYGYEVIKYRFENKSDMFLSVPIADFEVNGKMINRSLDFGCIYANKGETVEGTIDKLSRFDVEEIKTLSFELIVNTNISYVNLSRGRLGDYLIVL